MNRMYFVSLAIGFGLSGALSLSAQGSSDGRAPRELTDTHSISSQSCGIVEVAGQLRAIGPRYRAIFDRDGMTFTPALGSAAPQSTPLRLEVVSVRRGDKVLYDHATAASEAEWTSTGARVSIERAASFTERFDATSSGIELSWQFDEPLSGDGDLVVSYRAVTDLPSSASPEGLAFVKSGLGGVTIGTVQGIDAAGETRTGTIRSDGDLVELSLPASFVDGASYPLVLDPVINPVFMIRQGTHDTLCDIAYDATYNNYLFVWQTVFSQVDVEIRGQLTDYAMTALGPTNLLVFSPAGAEVAMRPRVGNVGNTNRFLVAWQQGQSIFGEFDIYCASVHPSTGAVSNAIAIAASATIDEAEVDVGSSLSADNDALVVWTERGYGIRGMQVDVPATGDPATVGSVASISSSGADQQPAISDGGTSRRVVVWTRLTGVTSVRARAMDINMNLQGTELIVADEFNRDPRNPTVDGDGTDFLVAWDYRESVGANPRDIWCRHLRYSTDLGGPIAGPAPSPAANANDDESDPAVALIGTDTLGLKYCLAWIDAGTTVNSIGSTLAVMSLAPLTCATCNLFWTVTPTPVQVGTAIASRYQAGEANADDCIVGFASADASGNFDPDIWGLRFEAYGTGGSTASLGGGCGIGGTTGTSGFLGIGSPNFEVRLSGAAGALGGVLVIDRSPPVNPVVPCGSCTVLAGLTTQAPNSFDGVTGTATAAMPIPCVLALIGGQLEVQWLTVNIGSSPCPIVPNISASNRLRLVIGE